MAGGDVDKRNVIDFTQRMRSIQMVLKTPAPTWINGGRPQSDYLPSMMRFVATLVSPGGTYVRPTPTPGFDPGDGGAGASPADGGAPFVDADVTTPPADAGGSDGPVAAPAAAATGGTGGGGSAGSGGGGGSIDASAATPPPARRLHRRRRRALESDPARQPSPSGGQSGTPTTPVREQRARSPGGCSMWRCRRAASAAPLLGPPAASGIRPPAQRSRRR